MNGFKTYHPIVNLTYFIFVIGFSCFLMHPICLAISLASGLLCSAMFKQKRNLLFFLPLLLGTALLNPAFNHEGVTVLAYFPSGNPLTLESVVYGLCAGTMLASVLSHFSYCNKILTSDKFLCLFGKLIPSLSLIVSMTLRFIPKFMAQYKAVSEARNAMGQKGSRLKHALIVLSATTTWAFENSIDTADSMKARGYGLPGRTAYSIFTFRMRDRIALFSLLSLGLYTLFGSLSGGIGFRFFPALKMSELSPFGISVFTSYFLLCMCPIIIEFWEVRKWNASVSKG